MTRSSRSERPARSSLAERPSGRTILVVLLIGAALPFWNVGVRNYLIEGVSGAGKTSVAEELERRGYEVVHGDRVLARHGDPMTGEMFDDGLPGRAEIIAWLSGQASEWVTTTRQLSADWADQSGRGDPGRGELSGRPRQPPQRLHLRSRRAHQHTVHLGVEADRVGDETPTRAADPMKAI